VETQQHDVKNSLQNTDCKWWGRVC